MLLMMFGREKIFLTNRSWSTPDGCKKWIDFVIHPLASLLMRVINLTFYMVCHPLQDRFQMS